MTSKPASRRARAMTLAPRSCPSRPGLATTTRYGWSTTAESYGRARIPPQLAPPPAGADRLRAPGIRDCARRRRPTGREVEDSDEEPAQLGPAHLAGAGAGELVHHQEPDRHLEAGQVIGG